MPRSMTLLILALAAAIQPARAQSPALPPDLVSCPLLDRTENGIQTTPADEYRVAIRDGRVAVVVLDLPRGLVTRTDLVPGPLPGTSVRLTSFPRQATPGVFSIVFNRATLSAEGTVQVETFIGGTDRPGAPPATVTYRLGCGPQKVRVP